MEKDSPALNVYLGPLKKPWVDYCAALGKTPGAALREAIERQLATTGNEPKMKPKNFRQARERAEEAKERFEVLLTPSEKSALQMRAESENCSARRWVIDAIRAGLTKEPQFGMKEIEALGESNYQLLAIGRNLNQIAKALNAGLRPDLITFEGIQKLRKVIDAHTTKVSNAIRASLERWDIEEDHTI